MHRPGRRAHPRKAPRAFARQTPTVESSWLALVIETLGFADGSLERAGKVHFHLCADTYQRFYEIRELPSRPPAGILACGIATALDVHGQAIQVSCPGHFQPVVRRESGCAQDQLFDLRGK